MSQTDSKNPQKKTYHSIFNGTDTSHFIHTLSFSGCFETFYRDDSFTSFKSVSSYGVKDISHSILCASLKPRVIEGSPNTAIIGLLNGGLEQLYALDGRRAWSIQASEYRLTEVRYSNDARRFYFGDEHGFFGAFDEETKKPLFEKIKANNNEIYFISEFDNGQKLALFSYDSQIQFWDLRSLNRIASHFCVTPMKTAITLTDDLLYYSSFMKDGGLNFIDLRNIDASENFTPSKLASFYLRVQSLHFLSPHLIGLIFEDNTAQIFDLATQITREWLLPAYLSNGAKIFDFCVAESDKEVRFCGDGFVEVMPFVQTL